MNKPVTLAAACLGLLIALPLTTAAFVVSTAPAAAEVVVCSTVPVPATGQWRPPFQQAYALTSPFGPRTDPITGAARVHTGQDLVSLPGPGQVVAAAAGTAAVGWDPGGYGTYVTIDHGAGVATLYGHLARIAPGISTGGSVGVGQQLGTEGSTGHSTGDHLHFEVRMDGAATDPVPFMLEHGAPLIGEAIAPSPPPDTGPTDPGGQQGGLGFALPPPGTPRLNSLTTTPAPIPAPIKGAYLAAADRYHLPWALLAGIGMEETRHGATTGTSTAGAQGLMQFLPATWARYGVDGDGDGRADILNAADSAMSAANYLTASGVTSGADGVRSAIFAYNHADWYVNDVLFYAAAYGGGTVPGDPSDCGPVGAGGSGNPDLPPIDHQQITALLAWADSHRGDPYVLGANGPTAWDCSSFTQAAYARIGITLPRTAGAQRDWLAAGHGYQVAYGQEQPGDLIFTDTYLGPNQIGHVMIVADPANHRTIEAGGTHVDHYHYTQWADHHIFEIWRVGA
ncbi:peptidoglycan DD-metalloendopeptidase family protein [Lapillicoccus sp.]|uniref:peptidoglycan DD-metalloendopeptidase family protein n=1 Tax=Lapillicoccus sp. TaxID=1909287 RepID=UPI0025D8DB21|nr:peptidoglycan DD-metalloendopeptidase family protein [Lapillicoccus sp.]